MIPIPLGTTLEHGRIRVIAGARPAARRYFGWIATDTPSAAEATGNETYRMTAVQSKRRIPDSGVRVSSSGTIRRVDAELNISSSNERLAGYFGSTSQ